MTDVGELKPGTVLGGCRIVKLIGSGGMGEVYLAEHQMLQKFVAIKTARSTLRDQDEIRRRFLKEARLAARVDHPNVITIHDIGESNGLLYIVMQFVQGQDLSQLMRSSPNPLGWRLVLGWIREATLGLEAVHAQGLIHRDIKPHNLMLTTTGRVLVMDFGLVREEDPSLSLTNAAVGSPAYMSPEMCRNDPVNVQTDIYSMGATAYTLLAGSHPFHDSGLHSMIVKLAQNTVVERLDTVRPDIPKEVADLIARAMAPLRENRIADTHALIHEIDQLLGRHFPDAGNAPAGAVTIKVPSVGRGSESNPRVVMDPRNTDPRHASSRHAATSVTAEETSDPSVCNTQHVQPQPRPQIQSRRNELLALLASVALMGGLISILLAGLWLNSRKPQEAQTVAKNLEQHGRSLAAGPKMRDVKLPDLGGVRHNPVPTPIVHDSQPVPGGTATADKGPPPELSPEPELPPKLPVEMPLEMPPMPEPQAPLPAVQEKPEPRVPPEEKGKVQVVDAVAVVSPKVVPLEKANMPENPPMPEAPQPPQVPAVKTYAPPSEAKAGEAWQSQELAIDFSWCPPGKFLMGSPPEERERDAAEAQTEVSIALGFWMGRTEVTQGQWFELMGKKPWAGSTYVKDGLNYPAVEVGHSGEDPNAEDFCQKLTALARKGGLSEEWAYRLPTDVEWEYACRAGTSTPYSFDPKDHLADYGWYSKNAMDQQEKYAHQVRQMPPNPWGLHDMHGNVWEWCAHREGKDNGDLRVIRGGSWDYAANYCRSANRGTRSKTTTKDNLGFRLVLGRVAADGAP